MSDILARLNAAIDGLCPCGAEPLPGSAYCGYGCWPTHRAAHTTSDIDGTQMRWRPDLVTAHDDSDLTRIDIDRARIGYTGNHNPTIYRRADGTFHFRLDDGHRYVGCDVNAPADDRGVFTFDAMTAITDAWQRLDRELGDQRRTAPRLPAAGVWIAPISADPTDDQSTWTRLGDLTQPTVAPAAFETIAVSFRNTAVTLQRLVEISGTAMERMSQFAAAATTPDDEPASDHPLARVNAQRRNRTYGPETRQRPPRQIGR